VVAKLRHMEVTVLGEPRPWSLYIPGKKAAPIGFTRMKVYQTEIQIAVKKAMAGAEPFKGPIRLNTYFYRSMPTNAPKGSVKRIAWVRRHLLLTRPDLTNYRKACEDALNGIVFLDDGQVTEGEMSKAWCLFGVASTLIEIQELEAA